MLSQSVILNRSAIKVGHLKLVGIKDLKQFEGSGGEYNCTNDIKNWLMIAIMCQVIFVCYSKYPVQIICLKLSITMPCNSKSIVYQIFGDFEYYPKQVLWSC